MNESYSTFSGDTQEKPPLSWRDWAIPLSAVALAALWYAVFGLDALVTANYAPGLGVTATVFAHFAAVFVFRRHDAPPERAGLWLMAAALVLAVCMALYSAWPIVLINCFVILCVSAAATFRLAGHCRQPWDSLAGVGETINLTFRALTKQLTRIFEAIGLAFRRREHRLTGLWLGLLFAIPLLALVIALLSAADEVFGELFRIAFRSLAVLDLGTAARHGARTLFLALFLASGFHFLARPTEEKSTAEYTERKRDALPFLAAAILLDAVYILFIIIQIAYLFGGAQSAAMAGGWAEYARSGFFELVGVTVINLLFCLISSGSGRTGTRGGKLLFWADMLLLAANSVILVSAVWRMGLYIRAFGLSLLRLMTLWAMLFIAVLTVAAAVRLTKPRFRFGRVFIGFGLAAWCLFCLCNPAGLVARYNIRAYTSGHLADLDLPYLEQFYPDTQNALERYLERDLSDGHSAPSWSEWRLGFLF